MYKFVKVAVLCRDSSGQTAIHTCTPEVTAAQYERGEHYEKAKQNAENNSFEGPMMPFDAADPAAKQLNETAAWFTSLETVDVKRTPFNLAELFQNADKLRDSESNEGCESDLTVVDGGALRDLMNSISLLHQLHRDAATNGERVEKIDAYLCHDVAATRLGTRT